MSACQTNVIKIIESDTENWLNSWVFWWVKFSSNTIWLEAVNTRSNIFNIISPSGNDWISGNSFAWNSCSSKRSFESIPSTLVCKFLALKPNTASFADKCVLSFAANLLENNYFESPQIVTAGFFLQKKCPHFSHWPLVNPIFKNV